jgi:type I restriction enzyme, S subunit
VTTLIPIKHVFDLSRNMVMPSDLGNDPLFHYSLPAWHEHGDGVVENASDLASGKLLLDGGEVLVSKLNPEKSAVLLSEAHEIPTVCSPEFIALIPKKIHRHFAYYFMLSAPLRHQLNASVESVTNSHKRARVDRFLASGVDLPDLPTQRAIADFLDRETARIDSLIEKKQRLVELLGEKWESVVEEAITTGGKRTKLGHHIEILSGYAFPSSDFSSDEEDIRLLRGANVSPGSIRWDDTVYWSRENLSALSRFLLSAGDVVLGMDRPWVSSGIRIAELTDRDVPALLLQRVCRIEPSNTLNKDFMRLLLASRQFLAYFEPIMTGVSVPHISPDQVSSFRFEYVRRDEQTRRATSALKERSRIIRVQDTTKQSIDCLKEYRSALITSAVTGQIDVSTYARSGTTDRQLDVIQSEMQA